MSDDLIAAIVAALAANMFGSLLLALGVDPQITLALAIAVGHAVLH